MEGVPKETSKLVHSIKPIIGLVGGIGAGKSLVAALFAEHGARVIDADAAGHEALKQPAIREQVRARWGAEVIESGDQVNRRKLGSIVFADPHERTALQAIVFPWIDQQIRDEIDRAQSDPNVRLIVLDAAIMQETGWDAACDRVIFIDSPRAQREARLMEKRGWSADELPAREKAQMPKEEKRARAHDVLINHGTVADLADQVDAWFKTNASLFV
jgi:dephospho-CoA kinase